MDCNYKRRQNEQLMIWNSKWGPIWRSHRPHLPQSNTVLARDPSTFLLVHPFQLLKSSAPSVLLLCPGPRFYFNDRLFLPLISLSAFSFLSLLVMFPVLTFFQIDYILSSLLTFHFAKPVSLIPFLKFHIYCLISILASFIPSQHLWILSLSHT